MSSTGKETYSFSSELLQFAKHFQNQQPAHAATVNGQDSYATLTHRRACRSLLFNCSRCRCTSYHHHTDGAIMNSVADTKKKKPGRASAWVALRAFTRRYGSDRHICTRTPSVHGSLASLSGDVRSGRSEKVRSEPRNAVDVCGCELPGSSEASAECVLPLPASKAVRSLVSRTYTCQLMSIVTDAQTNREKTQQRRQHVPREWQQQNYKHHDLM